MSNSNWQPLINRNLCTDCGKCIEICPTEALTQIEGKAALAHPDQCTYCAVCEEICPVQAINLPFLIVKIGSVVSDAPGLNE